MPSTNLKKIYIPGWIAWHSSRQMNDLSFQKSPDKSQISYFLLCNYIGLFIPVARLESDRLLKHAQSLQLAGDKSHSVGWGIYLVMQFGKTLVFFFFLMFFSRKKLGLQKKKTLKKVFIFF